MGGGNLDPGFGQPTQGTEPDRHDSRGRSGSPALPTRATFFPAGELHAGGGMASHGLADGMGGVSRQGRRQSGHWQGLNPGFRLAIGDGFPFGHHFGFPIVRVPVLSKSTVVTWPAFSNATPSRMRMPRWAATLAPAMIAAGVANPMAHGQAIMSTPAAMMKAAPKAVGGGEACQRNWPQPGVHLPGRFRDQAPPKRGGEGDRHHNRHEHAADSIAQPLDIGPAGLGAFEPKR